MADKLNKKEIVLPESPEALAAIESMNEDLRELYVYIRENIKLLNEKEIKHRYNIGIRVNRITSSDSSSKYGENAVEKLSAATGMSTSWLYTSGAVASTWTKDEFSEFLVNKNSKGNILSFSHLIALATLKNEDDMDECLDVVYKKSLSSHDTQALVQEKNGSKRSNFNPTKVVPKSVEAGLRKLRQNIQKIQGTHETMDEAVFSKITEDITAHSSKDVLDLIEDVHAQLEDAIENLKKDKKKLHAAATGIRTELEGAKVAEERRAGARAASTKKSVLMADNNTRAGAAVGRAKRGTKVETS